MRRCGIQGFHALLRKLQGLQVGISMAQKLVIQCIKAASRCLRPGSRCRQASRSCTPWIKKLTTVLMLQASCEVPLRADGVEAGNSCQSKLHVPGTAVTDVSVASRGLTRPALPSAPSWCPLCSWPLALSCDPSPLWSSTPWSPGSECSRCSECRQSAFLLVQILEDLPAWGQLASPWQALSY